MFWLIQFKEEAPTGNHKGRFGTLIEAENQPTTHWQGGAGGQEEECGLVRDTSW